MPKNKLYEAISVEDVPAIGACTKVIYVLECISDNISGCDDIWTPEFRETKRIFEKLFAPYMYHLIINQNTYLIGKDSSTNNTRMNKSAELRTKLKTNVNRSPESLDKLVKILEVAKILIPNF